LPVEPEEDKASRQDSH